MQGCCFGQKRTQRPLRRKAPYCTSEVSRAWWCGSFCQKIRPSCLFRPACFPHPRTFGSRACRQGAPYFQFFALTSCHSHKAWRLPKKVWKKSDFRSSRALLAHSARQNIPVVRTTPVCMLRVQRAHQTNDRNPLYDTTQCYSPIGIMYLAQWAVCGKPRPLIAGTLSCSRSWERHGLLPN